MKYEVKQGDNYRIVDAGNPIQACMLALTDFTKGSEKLSLMPFVVNRLGVMGARMYSYHLSEVLAFIVFAGEYEATLPEPPCPANWPKAKARKK